MNQPADQPRVKTFRTEGSHPDLLVVYDDGRTVRCCGYSWCTGRCGLPAATLTFVDAGQAREYKAYSSMTACGPVIQGWRVAWTGETHALPAHQADDLRQRWWR